MRSLPDWKGGGDTCRVAFQTELEGWEQQCVLTPGT